MFQKVVSKRNKFDLIKEVITIALFSLLLTGCNEFPLTLTATPLPGWRIPVSELFIDTSVFPEDVTISFSEPDGKESDPTINHFFREWGGQSSGRIWQNVFRGYKVSEAEEYYDQLRESMYSVKGTPSPLHVFSEYIPPDEVSFSSHIIDEYYFACGQWDGYDCKMLARYKNYVTTIHLSLKTIHNNDAGLTYSQMEPILENMDQKFEELFNSFE